MRFAFIHTEKARCTVQALCRALDVSPSGFYAWCRQPESAHAQRDRQLRVLIRASHEASRYRYGSPRVHEDLIEQGVPISRKRVVRLMRAEGLTARVRKRFNCTTMSDHDQPVAANVLGQDFVAEAPNQRVVYVKLCKRVSWLRSLGVRRRLVPGFSFAPSRSPCSSNGDLRASPRGSRHTRRGPAGGSWRDSGRSARPGSAV